MALLDRRDIEYHARFGISPGLLADARVERVDQHRAEELGFRHAGDLTGVVYPRIHPKTGPRPGARLRRDNPEMKDGRPDRKYLTAPGDRNHLFFPPDSSTLLDDPAVTRVYVESEKAALTIKAAADRAGRRMLVVGLGGCWGWRGKIGKAVAANGAPVPEHGPLPDLDDINHTDADSMILFDSNRATSLDVQQACRAFVAELSKRGAKVRLGTTPAEPGVNGPDDYRAAHDDAALLALVDDAMPATAPTIDELLDECGFAALTESPVVGAVEPVLRRLAEEGSRADPLRRRLLRDGAVERLKQLKVSSPAGLVDAAMDVGSSEQVQTTIVRDDPPWESSVQGVAVVAQIVETLHRYIVFSRDAAVAVALWIVHSYAMDAWTHSPILLLTSPTKRCGKTNLLEVVHGLTPRPIVAANMTTAVLFRVTDRCQPTLLLDEADTWLTGDKSELRGIVNSGHRRSGAFAWRCDGDDHAERCFSTWAAKVVAMIGRPPDTIDDRSISIELRRKSKGERVERLRVERVEMGLTPLRRQLRRWADDNLDALRRADPVMPEELGDRAADNWRPLLAIADVLGGDWPTQSRSAAIALSGESEMQDLPTMLLDDIRRVFAGCGNPDVLPTGELLGTLVAIADRPWREFSHGRPLNAHRLARMLAPFGIVPTDRRIGKVLKSYRRAAFLDAWDRYLGDRPAEPQHRNNSNIDGVHSGIPERNMSPDCRGFDFDGHFDKQGTRCDVADARGDQDEADDDEELTL